MMTAGDTTPYAAPRAGFFSLRGRLGRVRYIAYSLGSVIGASLFLLLAAMAMVSLGAMGRMLYTVISVLVLYAVLPMLFALLTVKRAHDFNRGGWVAFLLLVPVINLIFWIMPGTRGDNDYGAPGMPTSLGLKLIALILPPVLIGAFITSNVAQEPQEDMTFSPIPSSTPLQTYKP